jgi:hypothetical protein
MAELRSQVALPAKQNSRAIPVVPVSPAGKNNPDSTIDLRSNSFRPDALGMILDSSAENARARELAGVSPFGRASTNLLLA